ncbi:hypothetical protein WR25_19516 [Diploscapter pachys]|uniref:Chloride channel protein n=1 Tax=Diploscapter pachys TaxID=2018661 RepID=A0A2A2KV37_9BILA|nr:hypothetical protein WR25_19516 [Diploscapter pachys]
MAVFIAMMTFPDGIGKFFAGYLTFHETLSDFIANCTFMTNSSMRCSEHVINHWTMGFSNPLYAFLLYSLFYFIMVPICLTLFIPNGIFVPCFVMGASAGRLIGEVLAQTWPEGMRGLDGPQIYPGLYAVVGAAAYTGSITHSLSIAVIVCETTGQLCALLPVLIMLRDVVYITRDTTYRELREILLETSHLRSYPFVADRKSTILLGSVSRRYLLYLLTRKLGPEPKLNVTRRRSKTASEIMNTINNFRQLV